MLQQDASPSPTTTATITPAARCAIRRLPESAPIIRPDPMARSSTMDFTPRQVALIRVSFAAAVVAVLLLVFALPQSPPPPPSLA